jgi:uncharacterized protein YkwD
VTTTVVALILAIPVISGLGTPAVELESSSTTPPPQEGSSPVVMGMDGQPASSPGMATSAPAPTSASASAPPAESAETADPVTDVLALVNAERAALGCDALTSDAGLAAAAQAHSATMGATGVLGLDAPVGAVAQGVDAQSVVGGWLADTTVSAALLDCSRTSAGIAVVDGWWTALLA